jgi:hypothetical protein
MPTALERNRLLERLTPDLGEEGGDLFQRHAGGQMRHERRLDAVPRIVGEPPTTWALEMMWGYPAISSALRSQSSLAWSRCADSETRRSGERTP